MPWSDWIQSPETLSNRFANRSVSTGASGLDVQATPGDAPTQLASVRAQAESGHDAHTEARPEGNSDAIVVQQQWSPVDVGNPALSVAQSNASWRIVWYGLRPGVDVRNMFPDPLSDLAYGVDYGPRPDRNEDEDLDAFVQYEDDGLFILAAEIQGWEGDVTLEVANGTHDLSEPWDGAGRAYLSDIAALPAPPQLPTDTVIDPPILPTYGSGATVTTVSGPNGTTGAGAFTLGAGTTDVVLVTEFDFTPFPDNASLYQADILTSATVAWRLLFPRWRYWIPREPYVRLLHRGDGLGLSSRRLRQRGHTNQAGRLRGGN